MVVTVACAARVQDKAIKALTAALAPKAKAMRNGKLVSVRRLPGSGLLQNPFDCDVRDRCRAFMTSVS